MKINDHRLEGVLFEPTRNMGGEITPDLLVIHYTVVKSMKATVDGFKNPARQASAHVVLDVDGALTQLVPFNCRAWHAGESQWGGRPACNGFSIGIELVNPGPLVKRTNGYFDTNNVQWNGAVVEARHKHRNVSWSHWAAYSEAQIARVEELGAALVQTYGLGEVVGHEDIAPTRKWDPGPAFPMESVRGVIFGRSREAAEEYAATTEVNIRKGPAVSFDTIAGSPLPRGKRVQVVDQEGAWWHVADPASTLEGWVHSRFLIRA